MCVCVCVFLNQEIGSDLFLAINVYIPDANFH